MPLLQTPQPIKTFSFNLWLKPIKTFFFALWTAKQQKDNRSVAYIKSYEWITCINYQYSFLNLTVFTAIPVLSFYGNQSIATSISYFEHLLKLISFSVLNDFSKLYFECAQRFCTIHNITHNTLIFLTCIESFLQYIPISVGEYLLEFTSLQRHS